MNYAMFLIRGKRQHPFKLDAMVVLPEHLHVMLTLPAGDKNYAIRWRLIKGGFSRQLPKHERISKSRQRKGERGIWQRRYWEHLIRNDNDYECHADYIHYNPVKHGNVILGSVWPYSTIHDYVKKGLLNQNWGDGDCIGDCIVGRGVDFFGIRKLIPTYALSAIPMAMIWGMNYLLHCHNA
jgi:putative transposase